MPGARPRIKPLSASVSSGSSFDEVSQLELHLQRQLEEDIARIFDESIYSDLEVVCGKLKILTHSCILKARTHKFYHKLETILHVNIGRNIFDEIYSFISDAYTECDIQYQENEIICYLNEKLNLKLLPGERKIKQDLDESDAYTTPSCVSPDDSLQKTLSSSPSTELTKEYYALVPIEGQVLDKELVEQDELSSGFNSFIHVRAEQVDDNQIAHYIKPTTLSLTSSHISKINNHSIICEISKDLKDIDSNSYLFENDTKKIDSATSQVRKHIKNSQLALKKPNSCETNGVAGYSPDSLTADEPSSSSDYLSAAHSASPGGPCATTFINPPDNLSKMNNTVTTVSDSGFDNNGMLESLHSHKDVTLADVSLTESTFHDLLNDEATAGADTASQLPKQILSSSQVSFTSAYKLPTAEISVRSYKDEKQRQNEEIVILESSSLSSETGSWESVFPPKMPEKDLCEKFINIERQNFIEPTFKIRDKETTNTTPLQCFDTDHKYSYRSTSCFIDAASLIDEEERPQERIFAFRDATLIDEEEEKPQEQILAFGVTRMTDEEEVRSQEQILAFGVTRMTDEEEERSQEQILAFGVTRMTDEEERLQEQILAFGVTRMTDEEEERSQEQILAFGVTRMNDEEEERSQEQILAFGVTRMTDEEEERSQEQILAFGVTRMTDEKEERSQEQILAFGVTRMTDEEEERSQEQILAFGVTRMTDEEEEKSQEQILAFGVTRMTDEEEERSQEQILAFGVTRMTDEEEERSQEQILAFGVTRMTDEEEERSQEQILAFGVTRMTDEEEERSQEQILAFGVTRMTDEEEERSQEQILAFGVTRMTDEEERSQEQILAFGVTRLIDEKEERSQDQILAFGVTKLIDEEEKEQILGFENTLCSSTRLVPCESNQFLSPIECSEGNDNDDSLEQPDPDSIQKDISPTIFEMTIASEESVAGDTSYEDLRVPVAVNNGHSMAEENAYENVDIPIAGVTKPTINVNSTPNNSIISLNANYTLISEVNDNGVVQSLNKNISLQHASYHTEPRVTESGSVQLQIRTPKSNSSYPATWVVDMSKTHTAAANKKPGDKTCDILKACSQSGSNSEGCKRGGSVDSDSSEKSTHKFYIDLSTLPDALAPEQNTGSSASIERKNIFSMFIDLGENSSVKEMPVRLSSSLLTKKNTKSETKHPTTKTVKAIKKSQGSPMNGDDAFEKIESLCNSSEMSISEIIQSSINKKVDQPKKEVETQEINQIFSRDGIAPTIKEESDTDHLCDSFVRLSDLDRAPAQKKGKAVGVAPNTQSSERMTRSIPGNTWGESCHTNSRSIDIISSFHSENALSLNRLFPHLKNDISRSMPGSLSGRTKSSLRLCVSSTSDRDELASDISEMSSVQSSVCRSIAENSTTEDTCHTSSLLVNCQSRLGQDLLRMFIEEIAPDVIVEVSGRRIKAHKCILSSRCQYFAGILSGGWVESAGNVISLPPFSYGVVHFALCHIYSGISNIPDSISIVELATIADMLSLEGLKEAIMFTLKAKYCHHFHEPCQVCTAGVLECFPLSSVYGLDELYRRCLRWITRHFRKVWPTKAFATLPSELLDKCYQEQMLNLSTHNLIDTVHDCALTVASLQRCRWAEVVARLCRRLAGAASALAAARLSEVVRAAAAARAPVPAAAARALDACLASAVDEASPDELCRALALLQEAGEALDTAALRRRCEGALLRAAPRALAAPAFRALPPDLRRRLRHHLDTAAAAAPHHPSIPPTNKPAPYRRRAAPPPSAPAPAPAAARTTNSPRVRTTKAQEERAKFNMTKAPVAKPACKTSKVHAAYENAKPRYLEPRSSAKEAAAGTQARRPLGRLVSSSESSRNSSPVQTGPGAPAPTNVVARHRPRTSADPSTESLSDSLNANKYATYTKSRSKESSNSNPLKQPRCTTNSSLNNKTKATKIPVYLNQNVSRKSLSPAAAAATATVTVTAAPTTSSNGVGGGERASSMAQPRQRGSLMMATKSSSAKMVTKIQKESLQPHSRSVKQEGTKAGGKPRPRSPNVADIPLMERSGTFLKDEPTFGDKTTNIDID